MLERIKRARVGSIVLVLLASALGACASGLTTSWPEEPVEAATVPAPEPLPEIPIEAARKPAELLPPPVRNTTPIAIVVSSRQTAYTDVAAALIERYDDAHVYELGGEDAATGGMIRNISDIGNSAVVAIGLLAARSAVSLTDMPVVYCQVFNDQELAVASDNVRGVAAYSPLDAQLDAWLAVDPELGRVGMLVGEGHDDLVAEASRAAERHGIDLHVRTTHSDQETLYAFRRMSRDIDGFWLFPDSRVLSARALREMAQIADKNRVRFAVPNEGMLSLGAAVALTTVATDIATVIGEVLERMARGDVESLPRLSQLREVGVKTSSTMAEVR